MFINVKFYANRVKLEERSFSKPFDFSKSVKENPCQEVIF